MENIRLNVKALAAVMGMSIEQMARECGIKEAHLKSVSSGRATMTAEDLLKLSKFTGVNPFNIEVR